MNDIYVMKTMKVSHTLSLVLNVSHVIAVRHSEGQCFGVMTKGELVQQPNVSPYD